MLRWRGEHSVTTGASKNPLIVWVWTHSECKRHEQLERLLDSSLDMVWPKPRNGRPFTLTTCPTERCPMVQYDQESREYRSCRLRS